MDKTWLRDYFNGLSKAERAQFCATLHTTSGYVRKLCSTGKITAEKALAIDQASHGEVPCWILRPDLWDAPSARTAKRTTKEIK